MSITLGIGTIITRYNVFKFKDILASLLGSFIEKDKKGLTDNYTQEYKDREFIFFDEDNNTEYTAQLIAIDFSNVVAEKPFVSYRDGEIRFEKAIKTLHEVECIVNPNTESCGNSFITESECFIYGCNSSLMYRVIDAKYKDSPLIKNLGFSAETMTWLIDSGFHDTDKLLTLNENTLLVIDTLSKEGRAELIGRIRELRKKE